jgi:ATP-dependent exoDNAse (exonuclease V) beta subunit
MTDSDRKNNGIKSCNEIDLRSHAVVEASAGTGKTYTITGLVVRLVLGITEPLKELSDCSGSEMFEAWSLNGDVHPLTVDQILLSTFTNAATEEMKLRVAASLRKCGESFRNLEFLLNNLSPTYKKLGCLLESMKERSEDLTVENYVFPLAAALMIAALKHNCNSEPDNETSLDDNCIKSMLNALEDGEKRLSDAVINIDRASVVTIHQFCKSMLHRYAFESRSLFRTELMAEPDEARNYASTREKRNFLYGDKSRSIVDYFLYKTLNESQKDYKNNISALVNAAGRIDLKDEKTVKNSLREESISREEFEEIFFKLQRSYEKLVNIFNVSYEKIITPKIVEDMCDIASCVRKQYFNKPQSQSQSKNNDDSLYSCIYRYLESVDCAGTNFKNFLFATKYENEKSLKKWVANFNHIFMETPNEKESEKEARKKLQEVYNNLPEDFRVCFNGEKIISTVIVHNIKEVIDCISTDPPYMPDNSVMKLYSNIRNKIKESFPGRLTKAKFLTYITSDKNGTLLKDWAENYKTSFTEVFSDFFDDKELYEEVKIKLFPEECEITKDDSLLKKFKKFMDYIVFWQLKYADRLRGRISEFLDSRHKLTYDDLISKLASALDEKINLQAESLAESIRRTYPVAILDEFQDTSPDQYTIFKRIYLESGKNPDSPSCRLVIVGDPKQAIYSFRAADVYSYLDARDRIISLDGTSQKNSDAVSSLTTNYRSNSDVVEFVNALFSAENNDKDETPDSACAEATGKNSGAESVLSAESDDKNERTGAGCVYGSVFDHRGGIHEDGILFAPSHLPQKSDNELEKAFLIHKIKCDSKRQLHLSSKNSTDQSSSENDCEKLPGLVYKDLSDPEEFAADCVRYLLDKCLKAENPKKANHDSNDECGTEMCNGKTLLVDSLYRYSLKKVLPSDIAILVKTGTQAADVKKRLESYGIQSVYLSERTSVRDCRLEVYFMEALLHALVYPTDQTAVRRLLTCPVMSRSFDEMDRFFQSSTEYSDFVALLGACIDVWEKQNFLAAFYHFVSSPQVMLMHRLKERSDGGRILTNIMHLAERVQDMAAGMPSRYSVYSWFCGLEFDSNDDEAVTGDRDDERIRLETQHDVVRIVTIFASKGLEYPAVINPYLAVSETQSESRHKTNSYLWHDQGQDNSEKLVLSPRMIHRQTAVKEHDPDNSEKLVLSLHYDKEPPEERKNETDDEKIRLMYVALTRARLVNMILIRKNDKRKDVPDIEGSLKLLLKRRFGIETTGTENTTEEDQLSSYRMWEKFLAEKKSTFESCPLETDTPDTAFASEAPVPDADEPKNQLSYAEFRGHIDRSWRVTSYSSLCHASGAAKISVPDAALKDDESESEEGANAAADTCIFNLDRFHFPRGSAPGTFIHRLLEVVPFPQKDNKLLDDKIRSMIRAEVARSYFAKSSVFEKWNNDEGLKCITEWFYQITTTPLGFGEGEVFSLSDIPGEKRLPEVSFTFSLGSFNLKLLNLYLHQLSQQNGSNEQWLKIPEESPSSKLVTGFLTGVIDLFFEHGGKYYVLDYKSNFISFSAEDYSRGNMENVIIQNRYDLQFLIYTLASWRFLKSRIKEFDFEKNFGGVLYLFVRGLADNCRDKPSETGAYYFDIAKLGNRFINTVDRIFLYSGDTGRSEEEILDEITREVKAV